MSAPPQQPVRRPQRPVPRRKVLAGMAILIIAIWGLVALTEVLRHPLPAAPGPRPEATEPADDPRQEVVCATPEAREGQARVQTGPVTDDVATVRSNELYDCPQTYDGQVVRYRGELVGAVLQRRDGAWVFLNDDVYAEVGPLPAHRDFRGGNAGVGVYIPRDLVAEIGYVGGPGVKGDIVEVVGTFHRVDPTTREVAVIRASSARIVAPGARFVAPVLRDRQVVATVAAVLALASVVAERVVARRR